MTYKALFLRVFTKVLEEFRRRMVGMRHQNRLAQFTSLDQFCEYARNARHTEVFAYQERSLKKRAEFDAAVSWIGITIKNSRFLDVGPGYGDALDICHEKGARRIDFIDNDPFFFHYNRLKQYGNGYQQSCVRNLRRLPQHEYDFIWLKGAINTEYFMHGPLIQLARVSLSQWLTQLEHLAAQRADIVIVPYWRNDGTKRETEDVVNNGFTAGLIKNRFTILPPIPGFCGEVGYPIAYHKRMP